MTRAVGEGGVDIRMHFSFCYSTNQKGLEAVSYLNIRTADSFKENE